MKEPSLASGLKLLHMLSLGNHVRKGVAEPRPQLVQSMLARSVGRKVVTDNFDSCLRKAGHSYGSWTTGQPRDSTCMQLMSVKLGFWARTNDGHDKQLRHPQQRVNTPNANSISRGWFPSSCKHHCLKLAAKAPAYLSSLLLIW